MSNIFNLRHTNSSPGKTSDAPEIFSPFKSELHDTLDNDLLYDPFITTEAPKAGSFEPIPTNSFASDIMTQGDGEDSFFEPISIPSNKGNDLFEPISPPIPLVIPENSSSIPNEMFEPISPYAENQFPLSSVNKDTNELFEPFTPPENPSNRRTNESGNLLDLISTETSSQPPKSAQDDLFEVFMGYPKVRNASDVFEQIPIDNDQLTDPFEPIDGDKNEEDVIFDQIERINPNDNDMFTPIENIDDPDEYNPLEPMTPDQNDHDIFSPIEPIPETDFEPITAPETPALFEPITEIDNSAEVHKSPAQSDHDELLDLFNEQPVIHAHDDFIFRERQAQQPTNPYKSVDGYISRFHIQRTTSPSNLSIELTPIDQIFQPNQKRNTLETFPRAYDTIVNIAPEPVVSNNRRMKDDLLDLF